MEVSNKEQKGVKENKKSEINPAIIEDLMKGYQRPEDLTGPGGIMEQLTKRLYERVLGAEMSHYLGYEKGQAPKLEEGQERENHATGGPSFAADQDEGPQRGFGRPIPPLVSEIQAATTNAGARPQGGLTPDFLTLSWLITGVSLGGLDDN